MSERGRDVMREYGRASYQYNGKGEINLGKHGNSTEDVKTSAEKMKGI